MQKKSDAEWAAVRAATMGWATADFSNDDVMPAGCADVAATKLAHAAVGGFSGLPSHTNRAVIPVDTHNVQAAKRTAKRAATRKAAAVKAAAERAAVESCR